MITLDVVKFIAAYMPFGAETTLDTDKVNIALKGGRNHITLLADGTWQEVERDREGDIVYTANANSLSEYAAIVIDGLQDCALFMPCNECADRVNCTRLWSLCSQLAD